MLNLNGFNRTYEKPVCSVQYPALFEHQPGVTSGAGGHLVWIQPIRQIWAEVCDGSGSIHDLSWICACTYVHMQTPHLQQSVHFAGRAKDERRLIRGKTLKEEWKSLGRGKQISFYEAERKRWSDKGAGVGKDTGEKLHYDLSLFPEYIAAKSAILILQANIALLNSFGSEYFIVNHPFAVTHYPKASL